MATISLNIDDSLLHGYGSKMEKEGKTLSKWLESLLTRELIRVKEEEKQGSLSTDAIIDSFHLKGSHKDVPVDEMGKGAIASAKYL